MKIKFNWGTGIFITTVLFMIISVSTTIFFMNQDVELVTDNYYEKELVYQEQVDKLQRTAEMKADISIAVEKGMLKLSFPSDFLNRKISGEVFLYRAASSKKDYSMPVAIDSSGNQVISTSGMIKGLWKVQVAWSADNNDFYSEKNVMVF